MNKLIKNNFKKIIAYVLLFVLIFSSPLNSLRIQAVTEYDTADAIHISTVDDFLTFAGNCTVDTWSQNKIFILDNDIDLSETDFEPVPTFGGIFFGQGHVIKGISLTGGSNYIGLFRYVQECGEIYRLSVSGTALADNGHTGLALLAGCNYGLLSGCSSSGNVTGKDQVGSIAGVNELTGVITDCVSNGVVYGSHLTGGIAGNNKGSISNSNNHCFINTTASDSNIDLSSINIDTTINDFLTTENASSVTDIGGIAGSNSGIIRACTNDGSIGYQHVGYNIGGIAGSQTGYIEGCINYGLINGRKDVGGIAGQMEPSSELEFSADTLAQLNTELNKLHQLLTQLDNDASASSSSLTGQIDQLLTSVEGAQNAVNEILDNASGYFHDFSNLTDLTTLPSPRPVSLEFLDSLPTAAPTATPTATPDEPKDDSETSEDETGNDDDNNDDNKNDGSDSTTNGEGEGGATTGNEGGAGSGGTTNEGNTGNESNQGDGTTSNAGSESNSTTSNNLQGRTSTFFTMEQGEFMPETLSANPPIYTGLVLHDPNADPDTDTDADTDSDTDPEPTPTATPEFKWPENWPSVSGNTLLDDIDREQLEKDINKAQENVYEDTSKTLKDLQGNVQNQAAIISSHIASARNSLSSSFSAIISDMRLLNSMLDDENQILLDDFQAIIDELNVIGNLLTKPETADPDDILSDVSDEDQLTDTTGKVMNCANNGKINGDLNVGGIAGSLSRENNLDPEDDLDLDDYDITLKFRYKERIVIRQCSNSGNVIGKKDCVGGIAGEMNLGSIIDCISSGTITSEGAMVGGIAGSSTSTIRSSSAKCTLKGSSQIGGIAGYGTTITDCYSMVQINEGDYYLGSIAGNAASDSVISNNYFVEGCPAGIDGISYEGKAQPLSYEAFMASPDLPDIFNNLYLTFVADGKTVSVIALKYGDTFQPDVLPQVPSKEGCIGNWSDFDQVSITFDQTIEAIYTEYITTLESSQQVNERPVVLIEGTFGPEDDFTLTQIDAYPEDSMTKAQCWKIAISGISTGPYTIRYLIPEEMEHPQIEIYENGTWKAIDTETDGSYYVFISNKSDIVFSCVDRPAASATGTIIVLIVCAAVLILLLLTVLFIKKKRGLPS